MGNDHPKSAHMNQVKLSDHVVRDCPEGVHGLERNVLGQVFIHRVLELGNVHALELPCKRRLMR